MEVHGRVAIWNWSEEKMSQEGHAQQEFIFIFIFIFIIMHN
jgi:hypothetical protein